MVNMLDKRLKMIYDLLPDGILCDVGTDHCKLAAYAVMKGRSTRAVATDIRRGQLAAAAKTVSERGLSEKITLLLSDGFRDIPDDVFSSVDCFVIAGMGGELIESILSARHTDKPLVLQPMSAVYELCEYLAKSGYRIMRRTFCRDGDKMYTAMLCAYDGVKREFDPFCGSERGEMYRQYLKRELLRLKRAISGMKMGTDVDITAPQQLYELIEMRLKEIGDEDESQ